MIIFMSKNFLISLWQRETQVSFFWKIKAWTVKFSFINKPPCFSEVMVLIFYFISIFQRNENIFISLVLKQRNRRQFSCHMFSLNFKLINSPSNFCFVCFHFPGLLNLNSFTRRVVSMLFLHECSFSLLSPFI